VPDIASDLGQVEAPHLALRVCGEKNAHLDARSDARLQREARPSSVPSRTERMRRPIARPEVACPEGETPAARPARRRRNHERRAGGRPLPHPSLRTRKALPPRPAARLPALPPRVPGARVSALWGARHPGRPLPEACRGDVCEGVPPMRNGVLGARGAPRTLPPMHGSVPEVGTAGCGLALHPIRRSFGHLRPHAASTFGRSLASTGSPPCALPPSLAW